jgi:hypothetical protein
LIAGPLHNRGFWESKYDAALRYMSRPERSLHRGLIEVASQHPLARGREPDDEFKARLHLSIQLFRQRVAAGDEVEIYVPGSRHREGLVVDEISLSQAGKEYLIRLGIPQTSIRGEDLNEKYRGEAGVYGSADECYVTASYYRDGNFGTLLSVLSPAQVMRKALHYVAFGVLPLLHTAPVLPMHHNFIDEAFDSIPRVLFDDAYLEPSESAWARELRNERRPG